MMGLAFECTSSFHGSQIYVVTALCGFICGSIWSVSHIVSRMFVQLSGNMFLSLPNWKNKLMYCSRN